MTDTFEKAFHLILEHEGGYSNDALDPGGETRYGIAKRSHPEIDITNLTVEEAKKIYLHDYWRPIKGDSLPDKIAVMVFDFAVNAGVGRATKTLQEVLGVHADGIIGTKTLDAVYDINVNEFLIGYSSKRMEHYKSLPTFKRFGKGWLSRTNKTLKYCQSMGS